MKKKTLTVDLKEVQIKELTKLYHESEFELKDLKEKYYKLKENFSKIRKNYDREKDRLDMALRALDNATNKI